MCNSLSVSFISFLKITRMSKLNGTKIYIFIKLNRPCALVSHYILQIPTIIYIRSNTTVRFNHAFLTSFIFHWAAILDHAEDVRTQCSSRAITGAPYLNLDQQLLIFRTRLFPTHSIFITMHKYYDELWAYLF